MEENKKGLKTLKETKELIYDTINLTSSLIRSLNQIKINLHEISEKYYIDTMIEEFDDTVTDTIKTYQFLINDCLNEYKENIDEEIIEKTK